MINAEIVGGPKDGQRLRLPPAKDRDGDCSVWDIAVDGKTVTLYSFGADMRWHWIATRHSDVGFTAEQLRSLADTLLP